MKTKQFLTMLLLSICLFSMPKSYTSIQADSTSVTANFTDIYWHTKASQPAFTSFIDGYVMSSTKGVLLSVNRSGSACTTDTYPSITSISFLVNGNTLGRGSLIVSIIDGEEEYAFEKQAIDTSTAESQILTFDTHGSGQVKFFISSTGGSVYLSNMTLTYGDTSLSEAHQYASSFLAATNNKNGQCHLIDWSSLEEDYLLLDETAKTYLRESSESNLLQSFQERYQYLKSNLQFSDFLEINRRLSIISNHQEKSRIRHIFSLFILGLGSLAFYHLLQRKPHHLN